MSLLARKTLLWGSVTLFLIVAIVVLFYSFGYRFSTTNGITLTGGLFIVTTPPTDAKIFINGNLVKTTSLLSRNAFIQSLTPNRYRIAIKHDGFRQWGKTIEVKPEIVTEVRALLIHDPPKAKILARGNFAEIATWNETTIELKTEAGRKRYFDTSNERFLLRADVAASSTPRTFSKELLEIIKKKSADGYAVDAGTNRLLWWKNKKLSVQWLPGTTLPYYTATSTTNIFTSSHFIRKTVFYPRREAVIAESSNAVLVIELDGRGGHIITPLYEGKKPHIVLPDIEKRGLYILDDGLLIRAELL